jgi:hypothetical protein
MTVQPDRAIIDFIVARFEEMPREEQRRMTDKFRAVGEGGPEPAQPRPVGVDGPVSPPSDWIDGIMEDWASSAMLGELDPLLAARGDAIGTIIARVASIWDDHVDYRLEWLPD